MSDKEKPGCCKPDPDSAIVEHDNDTQIMHRSDLDLSTPPKVNGTASCGCGCECSGTPVKSRRILWLALLLLAAAVLAIALLKR